VIKRNLEPMLLGFRDVTTDQCSVVNDLN